MHNSTRRLLVALSLLALIALWLSGAGDERRQPAAPASAPAPLPASTPELRAALIAEYDSLIARAWPAFNNVRVVIERDRLLAVHPFFNRYSFDVGEGAGLVRAWMDARQQQLQRAGIREVGVRGERPGDRVTYSV
jgi:hypothetical protein